MGKLEGIFSTDIGTLLGRTQNAIMAAIIGGTASVLGGGKFANGAVTGAMSRLLNDAVVADAKETDKKLGRILTVEERINLKDHFSAAVLDSVRLYDGKVPFWLRSDMDGVTLENDVYLRKGVYKPDTAGGVELLGHEIVHVEQYSKGMTRLGYIWESRNGYAENPYEIDAYKRGTKIRSDFCVANPGKTGC